jgi:hypothetical protein
VTKPMPEESAAEVSYREPLSEEYIATALRDARRFMGQWCGTSGNLAAHTVRLIKERERMLEANREKEAGGAMLEAAWKKYRQDQISPDHEPITRAVYGADCDRLDKTPAEQLCEKTAEVIRDRRPKYGGPQKHFARTVGMFNAAFADVLKRPLTEADWAVVMILDKVARFRGPGATVDGPVDIAGYAACLYEVMDRTD